jgi:endonuclease G
MPSRNNFERPEAENRLAAILRTDDASRLLESLTDSGRPLTPARAFSFASDKAVRLLGRRGARAIDEGVLRDNPITEAIILQRLRPALLVRNGLFDPADEPEVENRISGFRKKMQQPIASVGRIELFDHDKYEWCGTGWRVDDDLIITNRHVANIFARRYGREFRFSTNQAGKTVRARVDFLEEYSGANSHEFGIAEILWVAEDHDGAPDMAVLRIKQDPGLPPPLTLASRDVAKEQDIAVVGYPAEDSRNDAALMSAIFKDIYDVKRFAPGKVVQPGSSTWYLTHDATTLGGNSGSAVFDLASGEVVGLHFGGSFRQTNYAVKASVIKSILAQRSWVAVSRETLGIPLEAFHETKRTRAEMADRTGYVENFLGPKVKLPAPGRSHKVLKTEFAANSLPYTHFSVVMSEARRFAIFTAENIDGGLKIKLKRKDAWGFDPRIDEKYQVGHQEFYGPQPFDKGHMVRRENPGWGSTEAEATLGERDTFVYTNAIPQMPDLNQKTWLSLEDYVLDNAKAEGFKLCVFTGPVFRENDPAYTANGIKVPTDFWKVIVAIDAEQPDNLLVSAYMLSQESIMPQESFRFGPFRTYQVPLARVEAEADLKFSQEVQQADVFRAAEVREMLASQRFVEINSAQDIILTRDRG